jgi:hypothetical protein
MAAAPAVVLASHQFSDVPDSSPFHAPIARLVESGITTGCGPTMFCPKAAVTREQMAAFLTRGLGTAAASYGEATLAEAAAGYVTELTIRAGGLPGGTGYVTVSGSVSVVLSEPDLCPCGVEIGIDRLDGPGTSPQMMFLVTAEHNEGLTANTGGVDWTFQVAAGADATFGLYANVFPAPVVTTGDSTTGAVVAQGTVIGALTAEYSPFGSIVVEGPALPTGQGADGAFADAIQQRDR